MPINPNQSTLPKSIGLRQNLYLTSRLPSMRDQSLSCSEPIDPRSGDINAALSIQPLAKPKSTTLSPLLDTVNPKRELTTSSSEILGVLTGATRDTSISRLSKTPLVSAVCNKITMSGRSLPQPNPDFLISESKNSFSRYNGLIFNIIILFNSWISIAL